MVNMWNVQHNFIVFYGVGCLALMSSKTEHVMYKIKVDQLVHVLMYWWEKK